VTTHTAPFDLQSLMEIGLDRTIPRWAQAPNGLIVNIGPGTKHIRDAVELDWPKWNADTDLMPYPDGTVAEIHAYHFLEHLKDPISMLREFQRVLKPRGVVNIVVPYYNAQAFAQDLDHKHGFCEETWRNLFSNPYYTKNKEGWKFNVGMNVIGGIVERNICLFTQLIRMVD
jgi:SAM-dependent methyltransferase